MPTGAGALQSSHLVGLREGQTTWRATDGASRCRIHAEPFIDAALVKDMHAVEGLRRPWLHRFEAYGTLMSGSSIPASLLWLLCRLRSPSLCKRPARGRPKDRWWRKHVIAPTIQIIHVAGIWMGAVRPPCRFCSRWWRQSLVQVQQISSLVDPNRAGTPRPLR